MFSSLSTSESLIVLFLTALAVFCFSIGCYMKNRVPSIRNYFFEVNLLPNKNIKKYMENKTCTMCNIEKNINKF